VICTVQSEVSQTLTNQLIKARDLIDPITLPYVLATGKSELLVRDLFASQIDRSLCFGPETFVAREWRAHDLTVFESRGPIVVIEGKAWIHADVVSGNKLTSAKDSIKSKMLIDIEKINLTRKDYPDLQGYLSTFLVTCDSTNRMFPTYSPIKYEQKHSTSIRRFGSLKRVVEEGNCMFQQFIEKEFGATDIAKLEFFNGNYRNLDIQATMFLFKFAI
jgi:hypothetical protein